SPTSQSRTCCPIPGCPSASICYPVSPSSESQTDCGYYPVAPTSQSNNYLSYDRPGYYPQQEPYNPYGYAQPTLYETAPYYREGGQEPYSRAYPNFYETVQPPAVIPPTGPQVQPVPPIATLPTGPQIQPVPPVPTLPTGPQIQPVPTRPPRPTGPQIQPPRPSTTPVPPPPSFTEPPHPATTPVPPPPSFTEPPQQPRPTELRIQPGRAAPFGQQWMDDMRDADENTARETLYNPGGFGVRMAATSQERPEVGEDSSSATAGATTVVSRRDGEVASASTAGEGVETEFAESLDAWERLQRATKTSGLPELLQQTAAPVADIPVPKTEAPVAGRAAQGLRLDPFRTGGVDAYAAKDLGALGSDAPGRISEEVWRVVESLTDEEKAGQMTQVHVSQLVGHDGQLNATAVEFWIDTMKAGAVVGTPGGGRGGQFAWYSAQALANVTNAVQRVARARGSRVPLLWALDTERGAGTAKHAAMFPGGVGLAATFDAEHAYTAARISAKDARAGGCAWVLAPGAGVAVDKRDAQAARGFGEDPVLASVMVSHAVRGCQGDYKSDRARAASCVRGFIGAGARHISDAQLAEYHVPPFAAAVNAGAASLMLADGSVNGEALAASPFYQRRLLRDQLRFRGLLLAGPRAAAPALASHVHSAADTRDAVFLALNNTSVDVGEDAADPEFARAALALVQSGRLSTSRLTESAARVVQLKRDLGLFDHPFADPQLAGLVGARPDVDAARNAVRQSLTLLKNTGHVLPLAPADRVLFVGPHLNSTALLAGSAWGAFDDAIFEGAAESVMAAVRRVAGSGAPVAYHRGFRLDAPETPDFDQLVHLARQADKIVVALGEGPTSGSGSAPLGELALDAHQIDLVKRLHTATNRPIVALLVSGRPRLLKEAGDIASAVLNAYVPGVHAAQPIAEALYGKFSPSGRLPVTYPRYESQALDTIWQGVGTNYSPAWPFGFGLGYSKLSYSNITLTGEAGTNGTHHQLRPGKPLTVKVTVHNEGPYDHHESVLLYTTQAFRTGYEPEHYRLRHFDKVFLKPGTATEVAFSLTAEELAYVNRDLTRVIDPSSITITINALAPNERSATVNLLA
ncbi:hypothetical protein H4R20_005079, partial [Coemansia guatemalensis]